MAIKAARNVDFKKSSVKPLAERESSGKLWLVVDEGVAGDNPPKSSVPPKLSHDIRTQLYVITGFAELMLEEIPGKINDEQRRNLNDILNSGKRLMGLLNNIVK